jgi:hypothetical protein
MTTLRTRDNRCDLILHLIDGCLAEYGAASIAARPARRRRTRPPREDR